MAVPPAALIAALADRYRIDRELGHGGMATVYLAEDLKHHRRVAVKVLRPELAAVLGAERFLKEIEVTANLQHPHILPLFDSGTAGDPALTTSRFLFYVMPYVEGENLRQRLDREKQLPVDEAVRIVTQVAGALDYAHRHGVIHRDIKPENILLHEGSALLADFGIALAVKQAAGERLTQTGMSIGTPNYMSPEQATGERELDARSDLYSLGSVLYEMLAGEAPHTGPNQRAVIAKLMTAEPVGLDVLRPAVPPAVHRAVHRALAKVPADRFATVAEFATALAAPESTATMTAAAVERAGRRFRGTPVALALATVVLALAVAAAILATRRSTGGLDPNLMAVFPFRLGGTDTSQARLRDGMVDLLETKFSGEGGPRVLPAQTAIAAWRRARAAGGEDPTVEEAARLARRLGAGSMVLGTIVATPGHLILRGTLSDAGSGRIRAETKVEGVPDSVLGLVDALAARLVAMKAGMGQDRLASLTTTSLGALYAYLAGRAAHREGRYGDALVQFGRAIELDSSFALAGVGFTLAANWTDWQGRGRGLRVARAHQDRLSKRDRLIFAALAGGGSARREITAIMEAIVRVPDDPDLWTQMGDKYFHNGALVGVAHPNDSAALALNRALSLDTALNVEPMIHLLQIAEAERDSSTIRRLLNRIPSKKDYVENLLAGAALGDSAMMALAKRNLDSAPKGLYGILMDAQLFGFGVQEAEWALPRYLAGAKTRDDSLDHYGDAYIFYQHLGRPAAAAAAVAVLGPLEKLPYDYPILLTYYALLGDEDSAVARKAVTLLARSAAAPPGAEPGRLVEQYTSICALETWRLAHRDTATVRASMSRLTGGKAGGCNTMLRALLAAIAHAPDTAETLQAFEQQMAPGHQSWRRNLFLARLHEAHGDLVAALRAVRRRPGYTPNAAPTYALREEGRLAALVGDTAGAIRAYSHYLALRYNPEPSIKPEVDRVRAELARLVQEE
jgi:Protein kinase domain